jgi:hypothetical protein
LSSFDIQRPSFAQRPDATTHHLRRVVVVEEFKDFWQIVTLYGVLDISQYGFDLVNIHTLMAP